MVYINLKDLYPHPGEGEFLLPVQSLKPVIAPAVPSITGNYPSSMGNTTDTHGRS